MRVLSFIEKFILSLCLILLISLIPTPSAGMTRFIYDDLGRLATVSDDNGESVIYGYDSVGNLLSITGNAGVQALQVKSITPSSASQGDILTVTITGDNLAGVEIETDNSGITVGSVNTSRRSVSATFSISWQAVTGMSTVTLKTPLGYATAGFTVEPTPPVVTGLSPSSGPVSRLVTMTGNGFSAVPTENTVSFNGTVSPVITAGITSIFTSVPAGAATGPVTVTVNGLTSKGIKFTVLSSRPPPVIASITPDAGSVDGGTLVTVAGSGFTSDTKVFIGGRNPLTLQIVDASTITFKTPPGADGPADVLVTNVNGDAFVPGGFTYLSGPNESILRINPPLGRIDTPVNTDISVLFTRPVDRTTVTASSFMILDNETVAPVAGGISFDFGDRAVFFRPLSPLNQDTTYRISISQGIRSSDGIPLDVPFTGFFTTGAAADTISPAVTTSPGDGETVPYNSSIVFTFSEPMNPITLNDYTVTVINNTEMKQGEIVAGRSSTVAAFIPYSPFLPGTPVDVTLSSKVTDIAGNSIAGSGGPGTDLVFSFNTTINADYMPPRVLYINPVDGVAGVNPDTSISVAFSEPVNPVTVKPDSFLVTSEGENHAGRILLSNRNTIATFIPDKTLPLSRQITVTLTTDITDVSGNAMVLSFGSSFTTAGGTDNFQPMVESVSPGSGAKGVALNTMVQVVFSERVDPLTVNGDTFYMRYNLKGYKTVSGTITLSDDGMVATFTPERPLLPNTDYRVYVTRGITDIAGNPLYEKYEKGFRTGETLRDDTAPGVLNISPETGTTGVALNAQVVVEFTEVVAGTSISGQTVVVSAGGVPVEGETSLERGGKVLRWKPANLELLDADTLYEVVLTAGITDLAGNPLDGQYSSFFTTGSEADSTAPGVISMEPSNSTRDVALDTSIVVTFTEPVIPASIKGSFALSGGGVDGNIRGSLNLSGDRTTLTFTPDYPLFAGQWYTVYLDKSGCSNSRATNDIEDISGNRLPCVSIGFRTAVAEGTDVENLPTAATVRVNPKSLYADGVNTATVMITNINHNGVLVPNGTRVAVSVGPAYRLGSAGGLVLGGLPSPDPRFRIYTTLGGAITLTYQSPELKELLRWRKAEAYIQVAQVDSEGNPMAMKGRTVVSLVRGSTAEVKVNPVKLLVQENSYAEISIIVEDSNGRAVSPGTEVGITAEPVYDESSLGGTIDGGTPSADPRVKVFSTISGGIARMTYRPPVLSPDQSGRAVIQVVSIDGEGQVSGFLGKATINLSTTKGYPEPQSPQLVVQSISPIKGSFGVPRNALITALFSQPLNPATLNSAGFNLTRGGYNIPGTLALSEDGTVVTFTPLALLSPNSVYRIYIGSGLKSTEGKKLLNYVYSTFSTGVTEDTDAPSVTGVNPPDGMAGIGINTDITIEFSEQMDVSGIDNTTFTVSRDGVNVPGSIEMTSGNKRATFRPGLFLEPDTEYIVEVSSAVRDVAGNEMGTAFSSSFVTAVGKDVTRPSVTGVTPRNGAVEVPEDITLRVTFSERVNPLSINPGTFYLFGPGGSVPGIFTLGSGNTVVDFTPLNPLFAEAGYSLNVTEDVTDTAGNPLLSRFASNFRVAASPNTGIQPTRATITVNPKSMFADGRTPATVIISNINNNGTPVPNGTVVAVTSDPAFVSGSVGGVVSGASTDVSPDTRFTLFETYGAKIGFSYTPPDLRWMPPGSLAYGVIQIASVDADNRPARLVASGDATLYGIDDADVLTQGVYLIGTIITYPTGSIVLSPGEGLLGVGDPYKYLEEIDYVVVGTEWYDLEPSTVTVTVRDRAGNLVPDGTRVGLTAAPIYTFNTVGGSIEGGTPGRVDGNVHIFTTKDGQFTATYVPPTRVYTVGREILQVVTVDKDDNVTGLVSTGIVSFVINYRTTSN